MAPSIAAACAVLLVLPCAALRGVAPRVRASARAAPRAAAASAGEATFDVVVVGSGIVGATVATAFARCYSGAFTQRTCSLQLAQ